MRRETKNVTVILKRSIRDRQGKEVVPMRRIFLVLAVLAILVAAALPAMAQNRGGDNWDNNKWENHNNDWKNHNNDWGNHNNDWKNHNNDWKNHNNDWKNHNNDWGRHSYQPCSWFPWWGGWWNPCYGWWSPWW
jgi:hypothetical protein